MNGDNNRPEEILQWILILVAGAVTCLVLAYYYSVRPIIIWQVQVDTAVSASAAVSTAEANEPSREMPVLTSEEDDWNTGVWSDVETIEEKPLLEKSIDINTADSAELDRLPGIGPALAERIITYREENGRFSSIEELINVKGIGEKTFGKLADFIFVS